MVLLTKSKLEWSGGLSYLGSTCMKGERMGTAVVFDAGKFESMMHTAHEIAHT